MQTVNESLLEDLKIIPGSFGDPYQFGKEIARTARLALIAKEMNHIEALEIALASLRRALTAWLTGKNDDPVVYDTTYGGVVPSNGLKDKYADYGAGWYSDHHFHYGYLIYAAAVALKLDPPFAKSFAPHFSAFVRDICTLEESDGSFPFARHKDFYDGHSWASGLFSQANGKGQESSSEAVNAYYAVYLYAMESKQKHLMNFAHLLLAMEIQATKKYWHMPRDNEIYDSVFAASKMIGNLGAFDVTATTWFGFELEFVHGINM